MHGYGCLHLRTVNNNIHGKFGNFTLEVMVRQNEHAIFLYKYWKNHLPILEHEKLLSILPYRFIIFALRSMFYLWPKLVKPSQFQHWNIYVRSKNRNIFHVNLTQPTIKMMLQFVSYWYIFHVTETTAVGQRGLLPVWSVNRLNRHQLQYLN